MPDIIILSGDWGGRISPAIHLRQEMVLFRDLKHITFFTLLILFCIKIFSGLKRLFAYMLITVIT